MNRVTDNTRPRLPWHALFTRSRHEKKVAVTLSDRGFDVYLPLVERESQWHDRKKTVRWPLFPGYVFCRFGPAQAAGVLGVPGVASVVSVSGKAAEIPDSDIENVRVLEAAIRATGSVPESDVLVARGEAVRVESGPFAGVNGIVIEQRGSRVVLQVGLSSIQQSVRLEVPAADVGTLGEQRSS